MTQIEQVQIRELNQKIDALLDATSRIDERTKSQKECQDDHEERLRALESKPAKKWEKVTAIVITAIVTTGVNIIIQAFIR
ncbi:MAG TPA: hypothetical protein PKL77_11500 [Candidatus Omnitrophota bacterium]|nr:hypothetical protein [Candidatus Omnitrophota bacterium]